MAKFEIEAKIGANSDEFQRKMKEASKESREFAKSVHENSKQIKDVFGEMAGAAGLGGVGKAMKGGSFAAAAFFAAIIEGARGAIEAYSKLEQQAFKFGQILHDKPKGDEMAKWIEDLPGHAGNKDQMGEAMVDLLDTFKDAPDKIEQAKAMLLELNNASAKGAGPVNELADKLRVFAAGGDDAVESGKRLVRSFKEAGPLFAQAAGGWTNPAIGKKQEEIAELQKKMGQTGAREKEKSGDINYSISEIQTRSQDEIAKKEREISELQKKQIEKPEEKNAGEIGTLQNEIAEIRNRATHDVYKKRSEAVDEGQDDADRASGDKKKLADLQKELVKLQGDQVEEFTKNLTPKELFAIMTQEYGPGGASGKAADERGDTIEGKEQDVGAGMERLKNTFAEAAAPEFKKVLDELITDLPTLTGVAHNLGEAFGRMLPSVKALIDWIDGKAAQNAGATASEHNATQDVINKLLLQPDSPGRTYMLHQYNVETRPVLNDSMLPSGSMQLQDQAEKQGWNASMGDAKDFMNMIAVLKDIKENTAKHAEEVQ